MDHGGPVGELAHDDGTHGDREKHDRHHAEPRGEFSSVCNSFDIIGNVLVDVDSVISWRRVVQTSYPFL